MKRLFFLLQGVLFFATNFAVLLTVYQLAQSPGTMNRPGYDVPTYNRVEDYDPSLQRLNTIRKLTAYCDSVYSEAAYTDETVRFETNYPQMASAVVRKRFYHGYSLYGFSNNYMAMFLSKISMNGLSAIVIPDDILKYPFAACSQQSIVLMNVLRQRGFDTRKICFQGKTAGHFCFEVYYNGAWHFYDTDMEPDVSVLNAYNRPGVAFLASHQDILLKAYRQYPKEEVLDIFSGYRYGNVNASSAPRAYFFQQATKILSYTFWLILLAAFILARRKYLRLSHRTHVRNNRIHFPQLQQGSSPAYHLEY